MNAGTLTVPSLLLLQVEGIDGFTCDCVPGFFGDTCQSDVDECTPMPCGDRGACTNLHNNYTCNCSQDYQVASSYNNYYIHIYNPHFYTRSNKCFYSILILFEYIYVEIIDQFFVLVGACIYTYVHC